MKRIFELWRDFRQGSIDRPALAAAMEPVQKELQRTLLAQQHCADKKVALFCRKILTVVQTLRLQKRNVMTYLEQALESARADRPIPSLLPTGA